MDRTELPPVPSDRDEDAVARLREAQARLKAEIRNRPRVTSRFAEQTPGATWFDTPSLCR